MSNSYGSSSSRFPGPQEPMVPLQEEAVRPADYVIQPQYGNLVFVPEIGMSVDTVTGQVWLQYSPHIAFPQPFVYLNGVMYDKPFDAAPPPQNYSAPRTTVPLFVPSQQDYYPNTAPVVSYARPGITITRPTTSLTSVTEQAANLFLSKPLADLIEEEEQDTIIELPEKLSEEDLVNNVPFGVLDFLSLRMKCAEHLAVALENQVQVAHLTLSSDRNSVCTVFYIKKVYIVDTYMGHVYDKLPSDFDVVGRVVLAREKISTRKDQLSPEGKIVVSHVLNARDDCFEMKDYYEEDGIRLGSFHYLKSDKSKVDPTGKSSTVRGAIVDLNVGVLICGSYGWTPVSRDKSRLAPTKDGKLILRSEDESGLSVENVFYMKDLNVTPSMVDGVTTNGVTIMPFIEGPLIRAFLSYGKLRVVSHSKIDLSKSKYRGSETLSLLFANYGLTGNVLFPGDYEHSNFHYNFILRDNSFLGSSRAPVGVGSLAYLGVTYNYSSDPDYCPYEYTEVISQPIEFKVGETVGLRRLLVTDSARVAASSKRQCIFVPRKMDIAQANAHLANEFGVMTNDSEGSVIIMQKDASNQYTNIVRVIHPDAANRLDFIEGANDMEAFLHHVPDSYKDTTNFAFRNKYPATYSLLFPKGKSAPKKGEEKKGDGFDFAAYARSLGKFIYNKIGNVGHPNTIYLNEALAFHGTTLPNGSSFRDVNNNPSPRDRLYIIAITFIMSLPPGRQESNYDIIEKYDAFVAKASATFEKKRAFIAANGKEPKDPLYGLNSRLRRRERDAQSKKSAKGGVKTVKYTPLVNVSVLGSDDLIDYYRGYNKIFKTEERLDKIATLPPKVNLEEMMGQFYPGSSSSSSSAPPPPENKKKKKIFRKKKPVQQPPAQ